MASKIAFSSCQFSILYRGNTEFISLLWLCAAFFIPKSYTLVDLLHVEECFERWGFAFKEILSICREISFFLSVPAVNKM